MSKTRRIHTSTYVDPQDVIELDRIRADRGVSRNALLRQAIQLFIAAQQNAA